MNKGKLEVVFAFVIFIHIENEKINIWNKKNFHQKVG